MICHTVEGHSLRDLDHVSFDTLVFLNNQKACLKCLLKVKPCSCIPSMALTHFCVQLRHILFARLFSTSSMAISDLSVSFPIKLSKSEEDVGDVMTPVAQF
ncbi:hypothetical protein D8B26_000199 [Coccidioides posadasii str. Silveira]|uniref:uncharacterized protein n=1 Tax=Coccidioides posadasii (strain RMSCC 757 / Silveira) TaxID=443226 RepID=UPI001BEF2EBC|nr:hypothetical protein D8B26_000199 [Coccidioides posadasii str. Silveira]